MTDAKRWFASDNNASAHPFVMEALAKANTGHAVGYGDDPITKEAESLVQDLFGKDSLARFVFNGTGANVYALGCLSGHGDAVLCSDCAHVLVDETGAAASVLGVQLVPVKTENGKIIVQSLQHIIEEYDSVHKPRPKVISLSQPTELGTIYSLEEIKAISKLAHSHGMTVHVDGARLSNAAAVMKLSLSEASGFNSTNAASDSLSDAVCVGGTKNGLMFGELVVFRSTNSALGDTLRLRKNNLQLASKMRFIAAQYIAFLKDGLWLENANKANEAAVLLAKGIQKLGIPLSIGLETNAVFACIPKKAAEALREKKFFYDWEGGLVRFMASWDTSKEDIEEFLKDLSDSLTKYSSKEELLETNIDLIKAKERMTLARSLLKSNWQDVERLVSDESKGITMPSLTKDLTASIEKIKLPDAKTSGLGSASFLTCTENRKSRRKYNSDSLSITELSFLLWSCAGVRSDRGKYAFRTVPSGGCRHPLDTLVYVRNVKDLEAGLYRYLPQTHELALVRNALKVNSETAITNGSYSLDAEFNAALLDQLWNCAALFVWEAVPYRTEWRYNVAAGKIIALDAGHACQALYSSCEALNLGTCAIGAYDQKLFDTAIKADGESSFVIYAAPVGRV